MRCRRRFHEHPIPARSKRQTEAKEKGFSSSSQSVSIFSPAFTDDCTCSVSWLCGNSGSCYLSKITQQYCHLLSTAAHVFKYISALRMMIGNPPIRFSLHMIPPLSQASVGSIMCSYYPSSRFAHFGLQQIELYFLDCDRLNCILATFARATSSALGQCSPVALPPLLLSQHRPPTLGKPESNVQTETSSSCLVLFFNFSTSFLPLVPCGQQSAWREIAHPDFHLPAPCSTTCNHPIPLKILRILTRT